MTKFFIFIALKSYKKVGLIPPGFCYCRESVLIFLIRNTHPFLRIKHTSLYTTPRIMYSTYGMEVIIMEVNYWNSILRSKGNLSFHNDIIAQSAAHAIDRQEMLPTMRRMRKGEIFSPHRIITVACSSTHTAEIFPKHCNPLYPKPLVTKQIGIDILHDSLWNKGMAFSHSERDRLGLRGLIPPVLRSIEVQVEQCLSHINNIESDINKNLYLQDLQNRNETLFHRVLLDNIEKMAPLIYTPTVGVVCQECKTYVIYV
jgi:hypothetical protein